MDLVAKFIPSPVITLTTGWLMSYGIFYGLTNLATANQTLNQYTLINQPMARLHLSSRTVSMIHVIGTLYLASRILITDPAWGVTNTPLQNQLLLFSQSYYIADTIYVGLLEWDPLFLIHHLVMISYWGSCMFLNQGAYLGALAMIPGEITNPIQLIWDLGRRYRIKSIMLTLTPVFTYSFVTMRCGVLPMLSPYLWYNIWKVPTPSRPWKLFWVFLNLSIMGAGFQWSAFLWQGYLKYLERGRGS